MIQDTSILKEKIINFLKNNGPSLPIHISKEIGVDMLFGSAFLSELMSEHKINHSFMKVGISSIYFLPGEIAGLEKFSEYLKPKEKEAFLLLQKNEFLKDSEQEPAIRIALTQIKDYAKKFEVDQEIIWRYFLIPESNYKKEEPKEEKIEIKEEELKIIPKEITKKEIHSIKKSTKKKVASKKSLTDKKNERFFNAVKEFLTKKGITIEDIIGFNKKDLILKVKINEKEKLLVACDKKRIDETDILNAYKKAQEEELDYIMLSFGEPAKKTQKLIEAAKKLDFLEKIE